MGCAQPTGNRIESSRFLQLGHVCQHGSPHFMKETWEIERSWPRPFKEAVALPLQPSAHASGADCPQEGAAGHKD